MIATGTVVGTTAAEVIVVNDPVIILTTDTNPVDMLTTVADGEVVVIVVSFGFDELGAIPL